MPGAILWRGPSRIDGKPIVIIGVWDSSNRKTGNMLQTYIIRSDLSPTEASKYGEDESVCGDCAHRGIPTLDPDSRQAEERTCYVVLGQGPTVVFKQFMLGAYEDCTTPAKRRKVGAGKVVRIGTYGDGAASPRYVWDDLLHDSLGHTGYTHQWRNTPDMQDLCMASVESLEELEQAQSQGWRTFRVTKLGALSHKSEIPCPSPRVKCEDCKLCGGTRVRAKSISITVHGAGKKYFMMKQV
jgi:hypothetical protein